jgi:hypothetical protein
MGFPWDPAKLTGRTIRTVVLNAARDQIDFAFHDGSVLLGVEGDCCSSSWIEHMDIPDDIAGAKITSIDDDFSMDEDEYITMHGSVIAQAKLTERAMEREDSGYSRDNCITVYQTKFHTTKGTITLEYRNESNGYYGGYLVELGATDWVSPNP